MQACKHYTHVADKRLCAGPLVNAASLTSVLADEPRSQWHSCLHAHVHTNVLHTSTQAHSHNE